VLLGARGVDMLRTFVSICVRPGAITLRPWTTTWDSARRPSDGSPARYESGRLVRSRSFVWWIQKRSVSRSSRHWANSSKPLTSLGGDAFAVSTRQAQQTPRPG